MCGIVGYLGPRRAVEVLLDGLKRLEYRGYDSAGIAVLSGDRLQTTTAVGKLCQLEAALRDRTNGGTVGIGHTRWATHGRPSEANAHPHLDCSRRIAVVHNGIIENYQALKRELEAAGHHFTSETDTEVIAHLVESEYRGDLLEAARKALGRVEGSFALALLSSEEPRRLVAARRHSPLVIGLGEGENFIASDIPALLPYTRRVLLLEDGEIASVTDAGAEIQTLAGRRITRPIFQVDWDAQMAEKGGYAHFMLKEIHEQPTALRETMRGRVTPDGEVEFPDLGLSEALLKRVNRCVIIACGTAYHAGLVAKFAIESLARIPVEAEVASELRYRDPLVDERTLGIVISQSGETADTLAALRELKSRGATILAITNVVGSSVARDADAVLYTQAGPEIAVASTKAYTTQLMVGYLLAIRLARLRGTLSEQRARQIVRDLSRLPDQAEALLGDAAEIRECARLYHGCASFLYLGRGVNMASALEGALKLKEISYIHAEGYAAGEMKHGPIALIQPEVPTVAVAVPGPVYEKMLGNIQEVKARQGPVIAVAQEGDEEIASLADHVIRIPATGELLSPVVAAVALQLLAYYCALESGRDIDQPRNLAKSVTVE